MDQVAFFVICKTIIIIAFCNTCIMQVLQKDIHRFMYSFWRIRQNLTTKLNPILKESYGISLAEHFLLEYISCSDLRPTELAEKLQIPAHTISKKLESLQSAKLIKRTLDPDDARKRVLTVTAKGEKILKSTAEIISTNVADYLKKLDKDGLEPFLATMERLAEDK